MISRSRKHPPHLPSLERQAVVLLLTICSKNRRKILACHKVHQLLNRAWDLKADFPVGRYVIMPDHMHLFVGENTVSSVSLPNWVAAWKGYVSRHWREARSSPIWQRSFWDRQLLTEAAYDSKWIYVWWNPVRHGLVKRPDEWPV